MLASDALIVIICEYNRTTTTELFDSRELLSHTNVW